MLSCRILEEPKTSSPDALVEMVRPVLEEQAPAGRYTPVMVFKLRGAQSTTVMSLSTLYRINPHHPWWLHVDRCRHVRDAGPTVAVATIRCLGLTRRYLDLGCLPRLADYLFAMRGVDVVECVGVSDQDTLDHMRANAHMWLECAESDDASSFVMVRPRGHPDLVLRAVDVHVFDGTYFTLETEEFGDPADGTAMSAQIAVRAPPPSAWLSAPNY